MTTLFFSYSHQDEVSRNELEKHLAMLKRDGLIDAWHDRRILAGDELDPSIDAHLDNADVILLLISSDFLDSRYCYDVEMQRAMERHHRKECRVIAVILRPCDWMSTPFSKLLVTPTDGRPVSKWPDKDEAFLNVVQQIRAALPKATPVSSQSLLGSHVGVVQTSRPRSSNMRLRQEFTEVERDRFQDKAFDYMRLFFEESLAELERRNKGIETRFIPVDARAFGAVIYKHGQSVAQCGIRNESGRGFGKGIAFCFDESAPTNTINESLSVEADEQSLYLRPLGMQLMYSAGQSDHMSMEGAAEYYWELLIEPLQR